MVTCLVDVMRPNIGFASLKLLEFAGCEVNIPETQTCCGQAAYKAGDQQTARKLAIKLLNEFESFDYIVLPSGSCAAMIRKHYCELVSGDTADAAALTKRLLTLAEKTYELTEFLVNVVKLERLPGNFHGTLSYHDSCSGLRELGIKAQARTLLSKMAGMHLQEMPGAEECCGFGGAFSVQFSEISNAIVERKCASIHAVKSDVVAGGDLGCLLNIEGKLRRMGDESTQVLHIAEILAGHVTAN